MTWRRMLCRPTAVFAAALSMAPGAAAQEWLTSFKPHPRCVSEITRAPAPDLVAGTTRLLLRISRMADDSAIGYSAILVFPIGSTDSSAWLQFPPRPDTGLIRRKDSLPPGRYVVRALGIGYHPKTDTVTLSADTVTTAWMFLDTDYSAIRCHPPDYSHRPTKSGCVPESHEMVEHLRVTAERFAIPRVDSARGLAPYRRESIILVTDQALCRRAAAAYGAPKRFPRKMIVLRLGVAGYLVYDPFEPISAGEYSYSTFFDRRWRRLFGLSL